MAEDKTQAGNTAWLIQTVEQHDGAFADIVKRLEAVEKELAGSVKRRDSIEIPASVKEGAGYKVYVDLADEAGAKNLLDAAVRLQVYANELNTGQAPVPPQPKGAAPHV